MQILSLLISGSLVLAATVIGVGQLGLLAGKVPTRLGVADGRLQPPSRNPNSVTSQAMLYPGHAQLAYATIEPLRFKGEGEAAMARLASLLAQFDRTEIVVSQPDYIYARCRTPLLKFTDDVEFWLDSSAGVIQVRSASRLGRKDFGVNRARIESIRARFLAA